MAQFDLSICVRGFDTIYLCVEPETSVDATPTYVKNLHCQTAPGLGFGFLEFARLKSSYAAHLLSSAHKTCHHLHEVFVNVLVM